MYEVTWIFFKYNIFYSQSSSKNFCEYIIAESPSQKIAWNYLKISLIVFIHFSKIFREYMRMENQSYKIAWNYSKNHLIFFKCNFFLTSKIFQKTFVNKRMENLDYKNGNIEKKYLKNMPNKQSLKVKK